MGGSLPESEIKDILELCGISQKQMTMFIETGTYKADTTLEASRIFDQVYSIELVEALYKESVEKCKDKENISLFLGNTLELLPKIMETSFSDDQVEGVVFFIDAHQSGPDTSHIGKNVPCLDEITVILERLPHHIPSVFIVDDLRLFDAFWDWKGINLITIEKLFKDHQRDIKRKLIRNDRFIISI